MDKLMHRLELRGMLGVATAFLLSVSLVALANYGFAKLYGITDILPASLYFAHAVFVGGPFAVMVLTIIMYQLRLQRKLWVLSRKDGLTGINNRRTFLESTRRRLGEGKTGVFLLLDADNFKVINDTYGHQAGDNCLKAIAFTLEGSVRQNDVVGRIGGEEFAIFLSDTTLAQAKVIGERLTKPISFQISTDQPQTFWVTLSVGAALHCPDTSLDALIAHADEALYHAKHNGRARLEVWTDLAFSA